MMNHEMEAGYAIDEEVERYIASGVIDPEDEGTEYGRKIREEQIRRGVVRG